MAGHSKWKQIKHYKAATDAKRGALFTKLIREITMAAKMGGGDPAGNARLRVAIEAGKAKSLPKENIDRAIKKGTGELAGEDIQEVTYEGYGPGGVALIIDAMTDNPTRTVADVRHKMSRNGGNLGTPGSVAFMFEKKGQLTIDATKYADEDAAAFHIVKSALESRGIVPAESEIAMVPKSTVPVTGADVESLLKLIEALEDLDDVQKVWGNFEIDDAELAKLEG
jgi:YebC/PmpR family DNA-binding regulatory protein